MQVEATQKTLQEQTRLGEDYVRLISPITAYNQENEGLLKDVAYLQNTL